MSNLNDKIFEQNLLFFSNIFLIAKNQLYLVINCCLDIYCLYRQNDAHYEKSAYY